jgi:hypothetical protein
MEDAVIARGFLVDAATNLVVATLFEVGPTTTSDASFTTALATAPASGNYYLRFEVASQDDTGGGILGARLHLDNVVVLQQEVPEPASVAVWGVIAVTGGLLGYRRRQQSTRRAA